ncbi:MAG: hypothetical protein MAG715_01339 [Methanonatronarchaeales archaeon]|nr:hypothetical protein [Methanonatronarchaeales archaeon]
MGKEGNERGRPSGSDRHRLPDGVQVERVELEEDGEGWYLDFFDVGWDTPVPSRIRTRTLMPGTVDAWHLRSDSSRLACCVKGTTEVALHDPGNGNGTRTTSSLLMGDRTPRVVIVPPGVLYGFRNIGRRNSILLLASSGGEDGSVLPPEEVGHTWVEARGRRLI